MSSTHNANTLDSLGCRGLSFLLFDMQINGFYIHCKSVPFSIFVFYEIRHEKIFLPSLK